MEVSAKSFLAISPLGTDNNSNLYFGVRPFIELDPAQSDSIHIVGHSEKLDYISYKYYGTVDYWWCIADINNLSNPLSISIGDKLRIPRLDRIEQAIKEAIA